MKKITKFKPMKSFKDVYWGAKTVFTDMLRLVWG